MEWHKEGFTITDDKNKIDLPYVHHFLRQSYWAQNIPLPVVQQSIAGSLCFSILDQEQQVGFARVITDAATFAYLADVFIDPAYCKKGLAKWLVKVILGYPLLQGLRRFLLATKDAHGLYEQAGFKPLTNPDAWMQLHWQDIYKNKRDT
jgi:N-acetylglutamate synthase-like GNAT family acetyltransferase